MNRSIKFIAIGLVIVIAISAFVNSSWGKNFIADSFGVILDPNSQAGANRKADDLRKGLTILLSEFETSGTSIEGINKDTVFIVKWDLEVNTFYGVSPREKGRVYSVTDWDDATPLSALLITANASYSYDNFYDDLLGKGDFGGLRHENVRVIIPKN